MAGGQYDHIYMLGQVLGPDTQKRGHVTVPFVPRVQMSKHQYSRLPLLGHCRPLPGYQFNQVFNGRLQVHIQA